MMAFWKSCSFSKPWKVALCCLGFTLLLTISPLFVGMLFPHNDNGSLRIKYLWGVSTILDFFGAEFVAYDLANYAQTVQYDLKSMDVSFENQLESKLLVAHAYEVGATYGHVSYGSCIYSGGYGEHSFFVPAENLDHFTQAMHAYVDHLALRRDEGGEGYIMEEVNMNKLLEWVADQAGLKYRYNPALNDPLYKVSGWIPDVTDAMEQVRELAKAYGLEYELKDKQLKAW